jgi:hypothetical protein
MKRNEQNPNPDNEQLDLASSLAIVDQLASRPDEPGRREESGKDSPGAGDLLFDLPEIARGVATLIPDSGSFDSISTDRFELDLDVPDIELAAASETIGDGLIAGSEALGSGLIETSELLGGGLLSALDLLGDGLWAFGEGLGGLFEALGDIDIDFDIDFIDFIDFDF